MREHLPTGLSAVRLHRVAKSLGAELLAEEILDAVFGDRDEVAEILGKIAKLQDAITTAIGERIASRELLRCHQEICSLDPEYMQLLPDDRRAIALDFLWSKNRLDLVGTLFQKSEDELSPGERCVLLMLSADDQRWEAVERLYHEFAAEILDSCGKPGAFAIERKHVEIVVARCKSQIHGTDSQTEQTLETPTRENVIQAQIDQSETWSQKIAHIAGALEQCTFEVDEHMLQDANECLEHIALAVGSSSEGKAALAQLLVKYTRLHKTLPNLFSFFLSQVGQFEQEGLDLQVWGGLAGLAAQNGPPAYWKGVGLLRLYLSDGSTDEGMLWSAKSWVEGSYHTNHSQTPLSWGQLHRAVLSWVLRSPLISEHRRSRMLAQLRVAAPGETVVLGDIEAYLHEQSRPSSSVVRALEGIAAKKNAYVVQTKLMSARVNDGSFTNDDLDRMWDLSCRGGDSDLAWRCATVAAFRTVLNPEIKQAWGFSGERRTDYSTNAFNSETIRLVTSDFDETVRRLVSHLCVVGPALPDLLARLDKSARATNERSGDKNSVEFRAHNFLDGIKVLSSYRSRYVYSFGTSCLAIPPFLRAMADDIWTAIIFGLSERFGLNSFGWKYSLLQEKIGGIFSPMNKGRLASSDARVSGWLRNLNPEQRSSWHEVAGNLYLIADDVVRDALSRLVTRLATVSFPSHYAALNALQEMRAPMHIIRDLEGFLMSANYSAIRARFGVGHRGGVPGSVMGRPLTVPLEI